jgi:hypothetical protein
MGAEPGRETVCLKIDAPDGWPLWTSEVRPAASTTPPARAHPDLLGLPDW